MTGQWQTTLQDILTRVIIFESKAPTEWMEPAANLGIQPSVKRNTFETGWLRILVGNRESQEGACISIQPYQREDPHLKSMWDPPMERPTTHHFAGSRRFLSMSSEQRKHTNGFKFGVPTHIPKKLGIAHSGCDGASQSARMFLNS